MHHPRKTDFIRSFLANHTFTALLAYYLLFVFILSLSMAGSLAFNLYIESYNKPQINLGYLFWYSLVSLHGFQPSSGFDFFGTSYFYSILVSISSILLPSIFFGTVIFKIIIPTQSMFVMRNKISVFPSKDSASQANPLMAICCYSSSRLTLLNLEFKVYARIFSPRQTTYYQIRNINLPTTTDDLPVPLPDVPILVTVPVFIGSNEEITSKVENSLVFSLDQDTRLKLNKVGELEFDTDLGDSCQLLFIISGYIPKLNSGFTEIHTYEIPEAVEYKKFEEFHIDFTLDKTRKVTIKNWDAFDSKR
ncbi:hypothetical protein [Candidatus Albibeggiatoa sp. nov. NOAA]|uniref:hypothetical protein n=1 Tax=Candidatus Albibeggiatoa sp. nov. NOAA TaxID=3162724 RepID=UPI0032F346D5|nr:hypothetical protein [Thiotrichaceae bacterium]